MIQITALCAATFIMRATMSLGYFRILILVFKQYYLHGHLVSAMTEINKYMKEIE